MNSRKSDISQRSSFPANRIREAYALHQRGLLHEARRIYEQILNIDANHFDALYLLGVVAMQLNEHELAIKLITRAIEINPHSDVCFYNLGVALQALGRFDEAVASYDQAIRIEPAHADAYSNRGNALQALKHFEAAVLSYDRAIRINPGNADYSFNQGVAYQELDQMDAAITCFDRAIALQPGYAAAHYNRGNALRVLKRPEAAMVSYDNALKARPDYAEAFANRGIVLEQLQQMDAAIASYDAAIRLDPLWPDTYRSRGNALRSVGRLDVALASYERAVKLKPDFAECHYNCGIVLHELGKFEAAIASYDTAIVLNPDYAQAHCNRGLVLHDLKRLAAAVLSFDAAIAIKPDYAEAQWNKSLSLLLAGDFENGWPLYEWRWKNESLGSKRPDFQQALWTGAESLQGKTIFVYSEQGLGDTIQFARYLNILARQAGRIIVKVPVSLAGLLRNIEGVDLWTGRGDGLPDFDFHCPLLSLPLVYKTNLNTIPNTGAYLRADPLLVEKWSARLGKEVAPRIGIVWSGSRLHANDRNRSVSLESLLGVLPDKFEYFSLQRELRDGDQMVIDAHPKFRHFGDELVDFEDTAALCELMDLIISVDTSVAHLSGAIGKPTWVMLPFVPDWRWMLDRDDSPWYSSLKLYRQGADRQWSGVIDRLRAELLTLRRK